MENELNSWALDFEDTLCSLLKSYMESKVRGIKVTQDEESGGTATFPTLLVRQIGGTEAGRTNEAKTINAIRPTFQITITSLMWMHIRQNGSNATWKCICGSADMQRQHL